MFALSRVIAPVPVPVNEPTSFVVATFNVALPPEARLTVNPPGAVNIPVLFWLIPPESADRLNVVADVTAPSSVIDAPVPVADMVTPPVVEFTLPPVETRRLPAVAVSVSVVPLNGALASNTPVVAVTFTVELDVIPSVNVTDPPVNDRAPTLVEPVAAVVIAPVVVTVRAWLLPPKVFN